MSNEAKRVDFPYKIRIGEAGSKVRRFLLHFLELQIPMGFGALICYLVVRQISASSSFANAYHPGTDLFAIGDVLFLTIPVVAWMLFRGHGWLHSLEIAVAMIAPVAAIMVLGPWTEYDYLTWLLTAGYPAMSLGMLIYMFYRRDHFTRWTGYSKHTVVGIESSNHAG